jgi:hypothetical protein
MTIATSYSIGIHLDPTQDPTIRAEFYESDSTITAFTALRIDDLSIFIRSPEQALAIADAAMNAATALTAAKVAAR